MATWIYYFCIGNATSIILFSYETILYVERKALFCRMLDSII